jgi:hypothetical protein
MVHEYPDIFTGRHIDPDTDLAPIPPVTPNRFRDVLRDLAPSQRFVKNGL